VPLDFEAELAALLDDLSAVQGELLGVLNAKRAALAMADVTKLAELQPREESLAARLSECQQRRQRLLASAYEEGRPSDNLATLARHSRSTKPNKLENRVKQASGQMRLLQHHSLANWVLAQRSLLHVSQLLEIIATGGQMRPTYGDKESVHACGSLVNQEA